MRKQNRRRPKRQHAKKHLSHHDMLTTRHMIRDKLIDAAKTEEEKQQIRAMFARGDRFILRMHEQGYIPGIHSW